MMAEFRYEVGATPVSGDFVEWVKSNEDGGKIPFDISRERIRGMAIEYPDGRDEWGHVRGRIVFHGIRSMSWPQYEGYHASGYISVGGKKVRAFTSSELVELPCGSLVDLGVLHVVTKDR